MKKISKLILAVVLGGVFICFFNRSDKNTEGKKPQLVREVKHPVSNLESKGQPPLAAKEKNNEFFFDEVTSKKLAQFESLHEVILKTGHQREAYQNLLQDLPLIQKAKSFLMETGWETAWESASEEVESKRIDCLNYLKASLKWKENPSQSEIVEGIQDFIENVKVPKTAPESFKKAVVGDQIEAYMALLENASESAEILARRVEKGSRLERIVQFSKDLYRSQHTGSLSKRL